jgi:glutaconyl-CoA/methylmalonyl-CoA decarboxylase subunit gamma
VSKYVIVINGSEFVVEVEDVSTSPVKVTVNGEPKLVEFRSADAPSVAPVPVPSQPVAMPSVSPRAPVSVDGKAIVAPMPGKILSVRVKVGDTVAVGDTVCTLEAMKMEMPISSNMAGTIQAVHVTVGDNVAYNDPLITVA